MKSHFPTEEEQALAQASQATDANPKKRPMTQDADTSKLAARREANRVHALKSRQRSKALLQNLQRTVTQLTGQKAELERENAVMRAQIEVLQQQNIALTQSQQLLLLRTGGQLGGAPTATSGGGAAPAMNAFAAGLFGLSQAAARSNGAAETSTTNPEGTAPASAMDPSALVAAAQAMIQGQAAAAGLQFQHLVGSMAPTSGAAGTTTNPTAPGEAASVAGEDTSQSVVTADDVVA